MGGPALAVGTHRDPTCLGGPAEPPTRMAPPEASQGPSRPSTRPWPASRHPRDGARDFPRRARATDATRAGCPGTSRDEDGAPWGRRRQACPRRRLARRKTSGSRGRATRRSAGRLAFRKGRRSPGCRGAGRTIPSPAKDVAPRLRGAPMHQGQMTTIWRYILILSDVLYVQDIKTYKFF